MIDPESMAADTSLTARQAEVLALRREGLTQTAIADRLGTTVANISSVERAGRENIEQAHRTILLSFRLDAAHWFTAEVGTHLRDLVESVYDHGDEAGVKVTFGHPELLPYLHVQFRDRLDGRRLTDDVQLGITSDGGIVAEPTPIGRE